MFQQRKLRDRWTEVHKILKRCSLVIAIENFESGFTIGQSIVECRRKDRVKVVPCDADCKLFMSETPGSLNRISQNFYKVYRNDCCT